MANLSTVLNHRRINRFLVAALAALGLAAHPVPVNAQSTLDQTTLGDVIQIAAGDHHACALTSVGGVRCWGANYDGQLGDGSTAQRLTAIDVSGLSSGVTAIAAGDEHTCAITAAGGVKCWGENRQGQLGDGSSTNRSTAVDVTGLGNGITAIAAGSAHTCAVVASGGVKCWGENTFGQLGDGSTERRLTAVDVGGLSRRVSAIAAGSNHTCALTTGGAVKCWGNNFDGQLGDGSGTIQLNAVDVNGLSSGVTAITAGDFHSCAATSSGIRCWGSNAFGQLGDGSTTQRSTPAPVSGLGRVVAIAGGDGHTCAVTSVGGVKCWGGNFSGQLGDGTTTYRLAPVDVGGLSSGLRAVAAGFQHTCAVTADKGVKCWGRNDFGQLGDGSTTHRRTAVDVSGLASGVSAIAAGFQHTCAVTAGGGVKCVGGNDFGQLGDGSTTTRRTAVAVSGLGSGISAIVAAGWHSCALTTAGGVKCWGENSRGELGDGSGTDRLTAVDTGGLGSGVRAIAAGFSHTCALTAGGGVKCWGANTFGQLGDGSVTDRSTAVDVSGLGSGVSAIAAGDFHTCAITSGGGVKCWGVNGKGQLGDGSTTTRRTPVDARGLSGGVTAIAAGFEHTCAITSGGGIMCWGANSAGQLGDGSLTDRLTAVRVSGLGSGALAIAAGDEHTCAINSGSGTKCWGSNFYGQVGDGTSLRRSTADDVSGLNRGTGAIAAGDLHTCAIASGGGVKCWGGNDFGQVGDGGRNYRLPGDVKISTATTSGASDGDRSSTEPDADASGRYVVFQSAASTLVTGDTNNASDIFRRDLHSGDIVRVSVDTNGAQINGGSIEASISSNGQWVVFVAPNSGVPKVFGESHESAFKRSKGVQFGVYLRDMLTGTTQFMGPATADGISTRPVIAPTGSTVVWTAPTTDPVFGPINRRNVFLRHLLPSGNTRVPGALVCVSCEAHDPGGKSKAFADGESGDADVSADGLTVVFSTTSRNLVPGQPSPCSGQSLQINLADLLTGTIQRISPPPGTSTCGGVGASNPSIDDAGTTIAYETDAPVSTNDVNQLNDIYVFSVPNAATERVSESQSGHEGLGSSTMPSMSGDGSSVAFVSDAPNLDPSFADDNEVADVYIHSLGDRNTRRVSRNNRSDQADRASLNPSLSGDGSVVAFESTATNLLVDNLTGQLTDTNGVADVFTVSLAGTTVLRSGTWWIPAETGWGLFLFDQGSVMASAWFTYDSSGKPSWLLGAGLRQDDGTYSGELLRYTGVPFNLGAGNMSESAERVGTHSLTYSAAGALRFDYTVDGTSQSKQLSPFPYGDRTIECRTSANPSRSDATNFSDVWWGGNESPGWGLFITHVDDNLYALWYTYDVDRKPVFFVASTQRQHDGSFTGNIFRQMNGTPLLQIDGQPASPGANEVGSATLRFSDGENGSFSYRMGSVSDLRPISRFQFGDTPTVCRTTARP